VVIRGLEQELYGIWSFLNGLVAYSGLLYLGLGSALIKYVAQYYATGDRSALNRLVSVVLTVYLGLGLLTFAGGVVLAPHIPRLLWTNSSDLHAVEVSVTVIVLAARLAMMFVGSVFSGVLVAQGRTDRYRLVTIIGHASRLAIVPLAVRTTNPLLGLALVVAVTGAIEVTALVVTAFKQDPALRCRFVVPRVVELRLLYGFGLLAFLLQAADKLISYTDTTVIGLMLGPGPVALYVLPLQLVEYGRIAVLGLMSVMLPHLSALVATGQRERLRYSYARTLKMTALVAIFVNGSIVWLGQDFLRLWVGTEFAKDALPLIGALGLAGLVQAISVQGQTQFCLALGRVRFAGAVLVAEGLVNLGLSVALASVLGILGVAVATAIPAVLISGTILPIYVARQVGASLRSLFRRVALPVLAFAIVLLSGQVLVSLVIVGTSYWTIAGRFILGAIVAAVAAWIVVSDSERRVVRVVVGRKRRRFFGAPA
jgi:O-antigen/teichoic acid export membrane protein